MPVVSCDIAKPKSSDFDWAVFANLFDSVSYMAWVGFQYWKITNICCMRFHIFGLSIPINFGFWPNHCASFPILLYRAPLSFQFLCLLSSTICCFLNVPVHACPWVSMSTLLWERSSYIRANPRIRHMVVLVNFKLFVVVFPLWLHGNVIFFWKVSSQNHWLYVLIFWRKGCSSWLHYQWLQFWYNVFSL